jgi:hypothetical protein
LETSKDTVERQKTASDTHHGCEISTQCPCPTIVAFDHVGSQSGLSEGLSKDSKNPFHVNLTIVEVMLTS